MTKFCEKKLIKLYSSINFDNPSDTKVFGKWDIDSKLKVLTHMTGEYSKNSQPNIYFKAKITLDATVSNLGDVSKSNIVVKDICFKNEFNVSASSMTDEYKYLYDISCSSADNAPSCSSKSSKSCSESCSKSSKSSKSSSSCSSELSLSDIIANGIEKQIMENVKAFIESDAFKIAWILEKGDFTLDTTKYTGIDENVVFPNVKMTIKHKLIGSSSSSSSSCTSSSKSHKPNHFVKMLIMGFVAVMIIMFLFKFLKNNYSNVYDNMTNGFNNHLTKGFELIKSILPKKEGYGPEPIPYEHVKPISYEHVEPVPYEYVESINKDNQDA